MEPGGGAGHGPGRGGEDRLIRLPVTRLGRTLDIGRQGHFSRRQDRGHRVAAACVKRTSATPGAGRVQDHCGQFRPEIQDLANPQVPPVRGPGPGPWGDAAVGLGLRQVVEQQLHFAATVLAARQPGRKDPGVIDHQDVVFIEGGGQLPEAGMPNLAPGPMHHQQPGGIPLGQRVLGHQLRRQAVIVILNQGHRDSILRSVGCALRTIIPGF